MDDEPPPLTVILKEDRRCGAIVKAQKRRQPPVTVTASLCVGDYRSEGDIFFGDWSLGGLGSLDDDERHIID